MNTPVYGAFPHEWDLLTLGCELTEDLLPVVSNPDSPISAGSNMKFKGKTPSTFNRRGEVTGYSGWTTSRATGKQVEVWREEPDYGICVQTRRIRALDLDVTDDAQIAEIEKFVKAVLPDVPLAIRRRPNSAKCLIAFEVVGIPQDQDLYKRTVKTPHGMIEFLATGQQFIAYGTHPSGVRYAWENEGEFPEIEYHVWESLWERVVKRFGIGEPTSSAARKRGQVLAGVTDRIVVQLEELDLVLGWGRDGQAHITCPFSDEHSSESVVSATSYFPAGTGGYELGHFKCLHAHCADRTDQDFTEKLGIYCTDLGELDALVDGAQDTWDEPLDPPYKRADSGQVIASMRNLELAMAAPHACGFHIAKDTFLEEIMLRPYTQPNQPIVPWKVLQDEDYTDLQIRLEETQNFASLGIENVKRALQLVARNHSFDSAQAYVEGLKWDGVPRVDRFFTDYIKVSDLVFGKAVARYLFTALAGRALVAGIKADMVPILISGKQGLLKTSAVEALAPMPDVFADFNLATDDDKRVRLIKGKMLAEMGEMRGLWGAQVEDVKAFISRRVDKWVPKYKEQSISYARRCVFIGTGNNYDLLNDPTGSRRFLPMSVINIDIEAVRRDVKQLWAEGAAMFKTHGIMWQDAERLAYENNKGYTTEDPWVELVRGWLEREDLEGGSVISRGVDVSTTTILTCALGHKEGQLNSGLSKRVGEVMRTLGWTKRHGAWHLPK